MKIVSIILIICLSLQIIQCSPKLTRVGYQEPETAAASNCEMIIKENAEIDQVMGTVIGSLKVGDTGFSTNCGEMEIITLLKKEACALGADIINLKNIKRPDLGSSCFRCTADFIKLNSGIDKSNIVSSGNYSPEKIKDREKRNTTTMILIYAGSFAVGYVIGYYLFSPK